MVSTIVAPGSAMGTSALAVIRLSGPMCSVLCKKFLHRTHLALQPRYLYVNWFIFDAQKIDQVSYVYFAAPRSFTGEDSLEITCHGNPMIVEQILKALLQEQGVRMAEPGEFSRRAFEQGKLDLLQAESIAMVIHAENHAALQNSFRILRGELSHKVQDLVHALKHLSARLELEVDFAEEEAESGAQHFMVDFKELLHQLQSFIEQYRRHARKNQVPRILLMGPPNAGKSSLINALVEENRLLVSDIAGTTRDFVEVPLFLPRGKVLLLIVPV
jgi:tRNA modification GTPase